MGVREQAERKVEAGEGGGGPGDVGQDSEREPPLALRL